jgi:peptidoglycan/LPS O-acetylase OafA/YrhL
LVIAGYCPDAKTRKRHGVSAFAIALASGSAGLVVSLTLSWDDWAPIPTGGQLLLTLIFAALLAPLIAGRGNVASLFPRKPWSHRP